jgi:hypothetical protein
MPSPTDRKWLRQKYPKYWDDMDAVWERIGERWKAVGPGADRESSVLGTALPTFCDLCQLPLDLLARAREIRESRGLREASVDWGSLRRFHGASYGLLSIDAGYVGKGRLRW